MAVKQAFHRALERFGRDRRGNYGMMMAIVAPMLLVGAGFGINIAQLSNARSNLLAALDSAVTSTARDLTMGTIEERDARASVEAFLFANGVRSFSKSDLLTLDVIDVDRTARTVSAQASVVVDVAFPLFGAASRQKITTESAAIYSDRRIEVAMMLDVTGSMAGQKLRDLKSAAKNAVTTLLAYNGEASQRVRIALVPYANSVNVGRTIAEASVFFERNVGDRKQAPASDDPLMVAASAASRSDYCATERKGDYQYTDDGPDVSMVNRDYLLSAFVTNRDWGGRTCPAAEVVPLTTSKTTLDTRIDSFVASGGTAGHIGIQWTWYMLSEKWASVVGTAAAPARRDARAVGKYAILMTDGEFNLSYFDITDWSQAYNDAGKQETRDSATRLCEEMRGSGIEIFTIGFMLKEAGARTVMKNCASPDKGATKHYFETSSGAELDAAFQSIAANIERLAIIK